MHFHFLLGQLGGLAVRYSKSNLIKTLSSPNHPGTLVSHYRRVNRGVQSPIQRVSTTMTTTNKDVASGSASFRSQRQQRNNGRHHQDQIHLIKNSHHQYTVKLSTLCRGTLCGMSSSSGDLSKRNTNQTTRLQNLIFPQHRTSEISFFRSAVLFTQRLFEAATP